MEQYIKDALISIRVDADFEMNSLISLAEENKIEPSWVIEQFEKAFNKRKIEYQKKGTV